MLRGDFEVTCTLVPVLHGQKSVNEFSDIDKNRLLTVNQSWGRARSVPIS